MAVKFIVVAINAQYVEELGEYYVSYNNHTIKTRIDQLQTRYVITTKDNIPIKAHFLEPWSNTPNIHVRTFAYQLYRRQVEC